MKTRLDHTLYKLGLVTSRSQGESYIKLGKVYVDGKQITKPGYFVAATANIDLKQTEQYVSRAGLKLASVAQDLRLDFTNKIVLDVGSSTGGFTDYALKHGAKKVFAIDVGTKQLHPSLLGDSRIELHEQTNILDVKILGANGVNDTIAPNSQLDTPLVYITTPDVVLIDVSFVSLRALLPHIATLCSKQTQIVAMLKPQFEAGNDSKDKGVIKNDAVRRQIIKDFELWSKRYFIIKNTVDSEVAGAKGNRERFYLLHVMG